MTPTDDRLDDRFVPLIASTTDESTVLAVVSRSLRRVEQWVLQPVDIAWLAMFRILFGVALAVSMQRFIAYGWIDTLLVGPRYRFHYYLFDFVEPLSSRGSMLVLFYTLVGLALCVAAGFAFRITAPLFAVGLTYIQLIDVSTYLNHYYLAGLLAWLFAVSPANRAFSIDSWIAKRSSTHITRAWLVLFRIQIAAVYIFAGLAKANSDWLVHGQPLGMWLGGSTDLPILGRLFVIDGAPLVMSWFGFLFDLTIVLWLSLRRTRPFAYVVVLVFHTMTRLLFDIGMFPIIMSIAALVFFDPSWPRALLQRIQSRLVGNDAPKMSPALPTSSSKTSKLTRIALGLGALYCLFQIMLPLRSHLYGGNVLWHEQGMRFSWRVMIRAKGGATTFFVRETRTGKVTQLRPREYLTPFQENEMASQPDLILQLAQRIARVFEADGKGPVEVRVESKVSINGRPAQLMIDPNVDLTKVHDGMSSASSWILPAPASAPPHTRPVL